MAPATTVRAKFLCTDTAASPDGTGVAVTMQAVSTGDDNAAWSAATPYGSLQFGIVRGDVAALFLPGREYYLDFSSAAPADASDQARATAPAGDPAPAAPAADPAPQPAADPAPAPAAAPTA